MVARRVVDEGPEEFRRALAALRAATPRPEIVLDETPAPQRLAPHAAAMTADVLVEDEELATGRLVLLHDPAGHEAWQGTFRLVTYVRADLEPEIAADPLLPGVGWTWLTEALAAHGATAIAESGTVTRVISESFGAMSSQSGEPQPASAQIEIRASWTPLDTAFDAHLLAWCDLLCTTAGLPPVPAGVATLTPRRAPRDR